MSLGRHSGTQQPRAIQHPGRGRRLRHPWHPDSDSGEPTTEDSFGVGAEAVTGGGTVVRGWGWGWRRRERGRGGC